MKAFQGTGRRKTAVARVRMTPGTGKIVVNTLPFHEYFPVATMQQAAIRSISATKAEGKFDINVLVHGGGKNGQAGAINLGIARAMVVFDGELRPTLRQADCLTRDPRMVERKKYGQKKARKRFQFSKR